jgi:BirA family biotin operon repressor/biotin-[acetyl-CoA-carboxylase] ligase
MRLILTDAPDRCAGLLPPGESWAESPADRLPDLWGAMAGDARAWSASLDGHWQCLLVVGDAPESQFDILHRLLRTNPNLGPVACVALTGRGFHGHQGRSWAAETGNLHLSVGLPLGLPAVETLPLLTMLPAVAVVETLRWAGGELPGLGIKWVNDILVEGRKVGGVLATSQTRGSVAEAVTLGIGLNVARAPQIEPTPFVPRTGALHDFTGPDGPPLFAVLHHLLDSLARWHGALLSGEGPSIFHAYRDASLIVGRRVQVWDDDSLLAEGRVQSIEPDLTLRIDDQPVGSGRLVLLD